MIDKIVEMETLKHKHLTPKQAEWYANLLKGLEVYDMPVEDLFFWDRLWANHYFKKRANCGDCYTTFNRAYSQH